MDVALIPPFSQLHRLKDRSIQMIIPEALQHAAYSHYFKVERDPEAYTIIDNGLFESSAMSTERLLELAAEYWVDEIVMPDVRGDMRATFELTEEFLNHFDTIKWNKQPNLMMVMQISDPGQIPTFIDHMLELQKTYFGTHNYFTVGLPRRLSDIYPYIRIDIIDWFDQMASMNPIHLLGYDRKDGYLEVQALCQRVRSIDTDAPFVWSSCGALLAEDTTPHERPGRYWDLDASYFPKSLIEANIEQLDSWTES